MLTRRRATASLLTSLMLGMLWAAPAALACTQTEYLTPEEQASGHYDDTPPPWETDPVPAPASEAPAADQGTSPATQPPSETAPEPAQSTTLSVESTDTAAVAAGSAGAAPADTAPTAPADVAAPTEAPLPASQPAYIAPAADTALAKSSSAPGGGPASRSNRDDATGSSTGMDATDSSLRSIEGAISTEQVPAKDELRSDGPNLDPAILALALVLLAAAGGAGLAILRRGDRSGEDNDGLTVLAATSDAEAEAELQEMISEERARQLDTAPEQVPERVRRDPSIR